MNRPRLVLLLACAAVACGIAAPALADDPPSRSKFCISQERYLPNGFCVVWDDPLGQAQQ